MPNRLPTADEQSGIFDNYNDEEDGAVTKTEEPDSSPTKSEPKKAKHNNHPNTKQGHEQLDRNRENWDAWDCFS